MRIIYKKGNLINATENMIAHGCNNRGVMGAGVAREIRNKFPGAYQTYKDYYKLHGLELGTIIPWRDEKYIMNCITQDGFGKDGKKYVSYDAIRKCMRQINKSRYHDAGQEIALPKIGAGLGGGDWKVISKIIEEEFTIIQPIVYELKRI